MIKTRTNSKEATTDSRLSGKVALVTGGSRGIGAGIVKRLDVRSSECVHRRQCSFETSRLLSKAGFHRENQIAVVLDLGCSTLLSRCNETPPLD